MTLIHPFRAMMRARRPAASFLLLLIFFCFLAAASGCGEATPVVTTESDQAKAELGERKSERQARKGGTPRKPNVVVVPPDRGHPIKWKILSKPRHGIVRIGVGFVPWCPEIPNSKPRINAVKEVDKPGAVLLTAYFINPTERGCAEVAYIAERAVKLRTQLRGRPIYDASQSPPVRRWPADRLGRGNPTLKGVDP
jgi:hypothetical protein